MGRTAFITILILSIIAGFSFTRYKHLAALDQDVTDAWIPLKSQLDERYSAISRFDSEVERIVGHDMPEIEDLEGLQERFVTSESISDKIEEANKLEKELNKVVRLLSERYPKISAGPQFDVISNILRVTDQAIGADVKAFNDAVTQYNVYVQKFPNDLLALILSFSNRYEHFQPEERRGL